MSDFDKRILPAGYVTMLDLCERFGLMPYADVVRHLNAGLTPFEAADRALARCKEELNEAQAAEFAALRQRVKGW